jgi:hypothetical protein
MLAYYETITAGMVKVKIVNRIPANAALRRLESFECVVTARGNRVYPYGYTIVLPVDNTSLLPRSAVRNPALLPSRMFCPTIARRRLLAFLAKTPNRC